MSVRKSVLSLTLLLGLSAASIISADVRGVFVADAAAFPSAPANLSNFRTAVAAAKALVDKGDLAAAKARVKELDMFWDGAASGSTAPAVAHWSVVDRAIDRGLDRALLALRSRSQNAAMSKEALVDLLAVVDQVSGKDQAGANGGRL